MRRGKYLAMGILLAAMGVCFISQLAVRADVEALSSSVVLDRFKTSRSSSPRGRRTSARRRTC